MTIDERLEALTINMELAWREIEAQREMTQTVINGIESLTGTVETLAGTVGALARLVESHSIPSPTTVMNNTSVH